MNTKVVTITNVLHSDYIDNARRTHSIRVFFDKEGTEYRAYDNTTGLDLVAHGKTVEVSYDEESPAHSHGYVDRIVRSVVPVEAGVAALAENEKATANV